jgi:hypothetical protein
MALSVHFDQNNLSLDLACCERADPLREANNLGACGHAYQLGQSGDRGTLPQFHALPRPLELADRGLSFNRPTMQYAETFHTSHQDFALAAPLPLSNSLADDVFDPPTSLGFRYTPPIGIFPVAKLDAGVDVCCYVLASLFEGCFRDIVAQLSRFYAGSRSNRTVR